MARDGGRHQGRPSIRKGGIRHSGETGDEVALGAWRLTAGGSNGTSAPNTVETYSSGTNSWATVASMPTVRDYLAAATGPDGRIYAIGGDTGTDGVSGDPIVVNTVGAYTPAANRWATVAPMPIWRHEIADATGPDGRIYAIGGDIGGAIVLTTAEAYDTGFRKTG
jgi:hypothetical protein